MSRVNDDKFIVLVSPESVLCAVEKVKLTRQIADDLQTSSSLTSSVIWIRTDGCTVILKIPKTYF